MLSANQGVVTLAVASELLIVCLLIIGNRNSSAGRSIRSICETSSSRCPFSVVATIVMSATVVVLPTLKFSSLQTISSPIPPTSIVKSSLGSRFQRNNGPTSLSKLSHKANTNTVSALTPSTVLLVL